MIVDHASRVARYGAVSASLALCSDRRLGRLVDEAPSLGAGIGGTSALLEVDGAPVFVKRIPLTDRERRPEHVMSTANLFDLPPFCQYGIGAVGSPGFGGWRELAANALTTGWVLAGRTEAFPLLYHWRVLPGAPPLPDELADVDYVASYWGESSAVRDRTEAMAAASASVVLFLEYLPQGLYDWLGDQLAGGPEAVDHAAALMERCLRRDLTVMNAGGLLHFDAHFGNIRTDGQRLYYADLGLATSPRFELSAAEAHFAARHRSYDLSYALAHLVNWLVSNVCGVTVPPTGGPVERNDYIRRCAAGAQVIDAPPTVAAIIQRYAPVAVLMNDFHWTLYGQSRTTPYPDAELTAATGAAVAAPGPPHA